MSAEQTLDQAIGDAAEELLAETGKTTPPDNKEKEVESDDEAQTDDTTSEGDDLDESSLAEAKYLYKLLKDPKQNGAVIAALAQQVGILKPENLPTTPKETKQVSKSIAEQVIEGLGDEYKFMSPKLGAVIESILESKIAELKEEHKAHITEVQQKELVSETESARAKLNKETNGNFDKLEPKMMKLMDEFLPSANQTVESYLRGIYTLASSGSNKANAQKSLDEKVRRNANDVTSRLSSVGTGGRDVPRPAKPGIKNAVEYALKQLEKQ